MSQPLAAPRPKQRDAPSRSAGRCRPTIPAALSPMPPQAPATRPVSSPRRPAALPPPGALTLAIYLLPAEGCVIRAMERGDHLTIRLEGAPGEAGTAALGNCLVGALERDIGRIRIEMARQDQETPLALAALLESLARLAVRQGGRPDVVIGGDEPAASLLARAFARGLARGCLRPRPSGGRP